jgi:hypothetical protein
VSETRTKQERIAGYIPVVQHMTLDFVAASFAVKHHERAIVESIEVDPTKFMPVTVRYLLPMWEEVRA